MKKIFIIGFIMVILIVGISLFINYPEKFGQGMDLSKQSVEYSDNGITLSIPGNWVSATTQTNDSVLAVADPDSKDSSGFNDVNVNIQKKSNVRSLESEFNSNYNVLARNSDFNILFEGNVTFNGESALEADYTDESSGVSKQHKAVWIQKGSDIYVILCSAPQSEFDAKVSTFDFIINSVQL